MVEAAVVEDEVVEVDAAEEEEVAMVAEEGTIIMPTKKRPRPQMAPSQNEMLLLLPKMLLARNPSMTPTVKLEDATVTVVEGVEEEAVVAAGQARPKTLNRQCIGHPNKQPSAHAK